MKKLLATVATAAALLAGGNAFAQSADTSNATATTSVTIIRPLTITKTSDLAFGRIVRPQSTLATWTIGLADLHVVKKASGMANKLHDLSISYHRGEMKHDDYAAAIDATILAFENAAS